MVRVPDFDPNTPSIARVYDYFLGGKDNFAADRDLGERLIEAFLICCRAPWRTKNSSPAR